MSQHSSERLRQRFATKRLLPDGSFEGYASLFHIVDEGRDRVLPGAFRVSLRHRPAREVKLLWQHDPRQPIGTIDRLSEDERGLYVKGQLNLKVSRAREAYALLQVGALDGLSIGYAPVRAHRDAKSGIRQLYEIDLWEVSLVTFPMQRGARIAQFKSTGTPSVRQLEQLLREAGGLSRARAKHIAAHGLGGGAQREVASWPDVLAAVDRLQAHLS